MTDKKIQCFLVEDDVDDQEIFSMVLNKISPDIECRIAGNGVEAIELLATDQAYRPAYMFMDVNMPKMNGYECLKRINETDRLSDCRVYMYSTTSDKTVIEKYKALGIADFIVKPAKVQELKNILSEVFNSSDSNRNND